MKYTTKNNFQDFEFHDAEFYFEGFSGGALTVTAEHLNIHKGTKENPYDCDMEIEAAKITFADFAVQTLQPFAEYQRDENDNLYTDDPPVICEGKAAEDYFIDTLKEYIAIYAFEATVSNGNATVTIHTIDMDTTGKDYFRAIFTCTDFKVEWDNYCGKAWYEQILP